jgi:redox-sensitive bicupin YhaK (pirin superfamily)
MKRKIKQLFPAVATLEGAGVRLHRGFGYNEVPLFDPFLLLDDFGSSNPDDYVAGFPWHPHRGIETVTYIINGEVDHQDSLENKGVIKGGDVQWMTAGSGIIHQEMPQRFDGESKGFQLWVNLPRAYKMSDPEYRGIVKKDIPSVSTDACSVNIITGTYGDKVGPVKDIIVKTFYLDVTLRPGKTFIFDAPAHFTIFLYIFEGSVRIAGSDAVGKSFVVLTRDGETIEVSAEESGGRFLLVGGEPIGEPVAWYGPIVMNTQDELRTAFNEYQKGTFVKHGLRKSR